MLLRALLPLPKCPLPCDMPCTLGHPNCCQRLYHSCCAGTSSCWTPWLHTQAQKAGLQSIAAPPVSLVAMRSLGDSCACAESVHALAWPEALPCRELLRRLCVGVGVTEPGRPFGSATATLLTLLPATCTPH